MDLKTAETAVAAKAAAAGKTGLRALIDLVAAHPRPAAIVGLALAATVVAGALLALA